MPGSVHKAAGNVSRYMINLIRNLEHWSLDFIRIIPGVFQVQPVEFHVDSLAKNKVFPYGRGVFILNYSKLQPPSLRLKKYRLFFSFKFWKHFCVNRQRFFQLDVIFLSNTNFSLNIILLQFFLEGGGV